MRTVTIIVSGLERCTKTTRLGRRWSTRLILKSIVMTEQDTRERT